jgi:choline binding protein A
MKKKLLLSSVAALSLFAAYNTANADSNVIDANTAAALTATADQPAAQPAPAAPATGKVDPLTGKVVVNQYQPNSVVSAHTGVVPANEQYKPETPAYNPYHGKPVAFDKNTFVRFAVKDVQGNPIPGVKVEVLKFKNFQAFGLYAHTSPEELAARNDLKTVYVKDLVSNAGGDVEVEVAKGEVVVYRVTNAPKGYFVPVQYQGGTVLSAPSVVADGSLYTNAEYDLVLEKTDSYNVVKDQWVQEEDGWKYYASNKAVTGWKQIEGKWYFFNAEGVSQKWWVQDNGTWYYLNGSGEMQTGWLQDNGTWYYLEGSGAMKASQWFEVDGKWYYVDATGALAVNTTVDGYTVNANGEWV